MDCTSGRGMLNRRIGAMLDECELKYKDFTWREHTLRRLEGYLECARDSDLLSDKEYAEFYERYAKVRDWRNDNREPAGE